MQTNCSSSLSPRCQVYPDTSLMQCMFAYTRDHRISLRHIWATDPQSRRRHRAFLDHGRSGHDIFAWWTAIHVWLVTNSFPDTAIHLTFPGLFRYIYSCFRSWCSNSSIFQCSTKPLKISCNRNPRESATRTQSNIL